MRRKRLRGAAAVACAAAAMLGTPCPGRAQVIVHGASAAAVVAERLAVDHVILGAPDLERGIRAFTELTGVEPRRGGRLPAIGMRNALVSLGPATYLEILSPEAAEDSAASHPEPPADGRLRPVGWAIATTDIVATSRRLRALGLEVSSPGAGSRTLPDGTVLEWQGMGLAERVSRYTPFFIQWAEGAPHPATTSPTGCVLESIEIDEPDPRALGRLLASLAIEADVREGPSPTMRVTLTCPAGRVVFGS